MREAKEEALRLQEAIAAAIEEHDDLNSDTAPVGHQRLYILHLGICWISFFSSVRFLKNPDSVRNEFDSVRFAKTQFNSDVVVIYHLMQWSSS